MSFNIDKPWIRVIELKLFKKVAVSALGKSFNKTLPLLTITADGSREGLQIAFNVKKSIGSALNEANVTIYNLSPDTRQVLMSGGIMAELNVGWKNKKPTLLASGNIVLAEPAKDGSSNQMKVTFFTGYTGQSVSKRQTFKGGTKVEAIVKNLAESLSEDVFVFDIDTPGVVGLKGYTVAGRSFDELNKLARSYGFDWSIQNHVFQAIKDADNKEPSSLAVAPRPVYVISNKMGNLFEATPKLGDASQPGAQKMFAGIDISAFINPAIKPGDIVKLESDFNKLYNKEYQVINIAFQGDSHGTDYSMLIENRLGA